MRHQARGVICNIRRELHECLMRRKHKHKHTYTRVLPEDAAASDPTHEDGV